MANETTTTTVATLIPDIIEEKAMATAETQKVYRNIVAPQHIHDFTGPGDDMKINQQDTVTFGVLAEPGANSYQQYDTTTRTLTPVYLGGDLFVTHQAESRSQNGVKPMDLISEAIATAWVDLEDGDDTYGWCSLYTEAPSSSPDHEIGTDGTAFNAGLVRQGVQLLMVQKAPRPYRLTIDPVQWGELMQDDEAKQLLKDSGTMPDHYRAVEGVRLADQWVGRMFGCDIFCNPSGQVESSGLHAIMFANGAIGMAYERIATDLSPSPSELNVEFEWDTKKRGWDTTFTVSMHVEGLVKTATTNNWMVDIIS